MGGGGGKGEKWDTCDSVNIKKFFKSLKNYRINTSDKLSNNLFQNPNKNKNKSKNKIIPKDKMLQIQKKS